MKRYACMICLFLFALLPCRGEGAADPAAAARLQESLKTMSQFMASPRTAIPHPLLQRATAVVIMPNMLKASFLVGARYGRGVLVVRSEDGRWGNPVFVTLRGGSFGLQAGLQSTDLILVARRGRVLDENTRKNLLLGADASIVAGTLGIQMDENTAADIGTDIYSFSRTAGLTAGFSLQGAQLRLDDASTAALYGKGGLRARDVLAGRVDTVSTEVLRFREGFARVVGGSP